MIGKGFWADFLYSLLVISAAVGTFALVVGGFLLIIKVSIWFIPVVLIALPAWIALIMLAFEKLMEKYI